MFQILTNYFFIDLIIYSLLLLFLISERCTGEEWLIRSIGGYLPGVYEDVSALLM